jgi:pimeloyl-ACP methyl ester carboxylesterase
MGCGKRGAKRKDRPGAEGVVARVPGVEYARRKDADVGGMPAAQIEGMRREPSWAGMEAIAPTLAYDHTGIMGKHGSIPGELAARVQAPTLVLSGTSGAPFMLETARTLSRTIPGAELRTLDGQAHDVHAEVLAPVMAEFFAAGADRR